MIHLYSPILLKNYFLLAVLPVFVLTSDNQTISATQNPFVNHSQSVVGTHLNSRKVMRTKADTSDWSRRPGQSPRDASPLEACRSIYSQLDAGNMRNPSSPHMNFPGRKILTGGNSYPINNATSQRSFATAQYNPNPDQDVEDQTQAQPIISQPVFSGPVLLSLIAMCTTTLGLIDCVRRIGSGLNRSNRSNTQEHTDLIHKSPKGEPLYEFCQQNNK